ncbi:MAG: hypothetical protein QM811_00840 [Pirellulales bacterium]
MAAFLKSQAKDAAGETLRPTRLLFNGGAFKAGAIRARLIDALTSWYGAAPRTLGDAADHDELDNSVARGAAMYGWAKQHGGLRIRGGTARSYYVGIETAGLAIPGAPRPLRTVRGPVRDGRRDRHRRSFAADRVDRGRSSPFSLLQLARSQTGQARRATRPLD